MNIHYDNAITLLRNEATCMPNGHFLTLNIQNLMVAIHDFKVTQQPSSAFNLIKKLVSNLLEGYTITQNDSNPTDQLLIKYRDSNLSILKVILNDQRFCTGNWIVKEVQKIWLECSQECKYSVEGIALLFKFKLLNAPTVDVHISQLIDAGNPKSLQFGLQLIRYFYIENASSFLDVQLTNVVESLSRISSVSRFAQQSSDLKDTLEVIRMNYDTATTDQETPSSTQVCPHSNL